ncbi:MAG: glucose-6-phosphate isomerase [Candidatus Omnitrophica bacterium]|nr:glucose-6-phosphate isomerase [Candidatus Omnitrophota bacterium]
MKTAEKSIPAVTERFSIQFPRVELAQAVRGTIKSLEGKDFARRLWNKDGTVWTADKAVQAGIRGRLGWLDAPMVSKAAVPEIKNFAEEVVREKFGYVVLLGIGGSSLAPDVFSKVFKRPKGYPKLIVLDSTDPVAVKEVEQSVELNRTLFIVSSKSGSTIETESFYLYFYDLLKRKQGAAAGRQFVAITDAGSSLEKTAGENGFRKIFLTPEDVGGRYSALTYFGLVPAALMGIDIEKLLERAEMAVLESGSDVPISANPAILLGAALAESAKLGRDKLTLYFPKALEPFGDWVEQLVAESTGKQGKGVLPVVCEPGTLLKFYGQDRFFAFTRLARVKGNPPQKRQNDLLKLGHPAAQIVLKDIYDIGALFFFWEMVTAVAGICLVIDPFDEPNVSESKQITKSLLASFAEKGRLREDTDSSPGVPPGSLRGETPLGRAAVGAAPRLRDGMLPRSDSLKALLDTIKPGNYIAFMIFGQPSEPVKRMLNPIRAALLKKKCVASTVGFGPRFLHSTGQLHKGGPAGGLFIQIVHESETDAAIPGKPYSFEVLKRAQALGDYESLKNKSRRIIRVAVQGAFETGLRKFCKIFLESLA